MSFESVDSKITVLEIFDENSGYYTFSLIEKGGPVIVSRDQEEGKRMMNEALDIAHSVRNLQYFDDISNFKRVALTRTNVTASDERINYIKLPTAV